MSLSLQSTTFVPVKKSYQPVPTEESSKKVSLESQKDAVSVQLSLDSSISCIHGISKKRCHQLENCGFHTVGFWNYVKGNISLIIGNLKEAMGLHSSSVSIQLRKLLHHFPRTYADLQNAQIKIDDGQYLIFIGKVLNSRY